MRFERRELERVLRLQQQSYALLKWLNQHLETDSVSFNVVHRAVSGPDAAEDWLKRNGAQIPPGLLPPEEERREFAHLLSSYLLTSFSLPAERQRVVDSNCRCFCDYCTYIGSFHRLVARQPTARDRQNAHGLKRLFLEKLTADLGYPLEEPLKKAVFADRHVSLELSCATYADQLIRRTEYASQGCAVLVLWRDVAWKDNKPRKKFELTATRILEAEQTLRGAITSLIGAG